MVYHALTMSKHLDTDQYVIDPADIQPLTEFQRDAKQRLRRLKSRKRPALLTVNGRSAAVLLDPASYSRIVNRLLDLEEAVAVWEGLDDVRAGRMTPIDEVKRDLLAKYGFPQLKRRASA